MPQFFVAPEDIQKKSFRLTGPEAFHVTKVLRYAAGQSLALFDGQGGRFEGVIERLEADGSVSGKLTATLKADDARSRGAAAPRPGPAEGQPLGLRAREGDGAGRGLDHAVHAGGPSCSCTRSSARRRRPTAGRAW
jgi:hypothetical protein